MYTWRSTKLVLGYVQLIHCSRIKMLKPCKYWSYWSNHLKKKVGKRPTTGG